jgi:hypothetical protein
MPLENAELGPSIRPVIMSGVASGLDVTQYVAVLNQTFAISFRLVRGFQIKTKIARLPHCELSMPVLRGCIGLRSSLDFHDAV